LKILALVASHRKFGNTELMVRQALLAATAEGATYEILRLTDLNILPCTGCMACAFKSEARCHLDDDMEMLLAKMRAADGLILGAPVYILAPAAVVKLFLDRSIMTFQHARDYQGKPGIAITVAGLAGWDPLGLPLLTGTLLGYGYRLADAMTAYDPGPGETLLNPANPARAALAGQRLLSAMKGAPIEAFHQANTCPVCRAEFFALTDSGVRCPICNAQGNLVQHNGKTMVEFAPAEQQQHRWTPEAAEHHLNEWILPSGPRYLSRRREIEALELDYRQMRP